VPNFPNLFCLYGPGTNLASGGSLIFHSECQVRYVMGAIEQLLTGGHQTMEVRQEVHDEYNERLQEQLAKMVWSHPSIRSSWYRNDAGEIYILSPWRWWTTGPGRVSQIRRTTSSADLGSAVHPALLPGDGALAGHYRVARHR
jgi:hypothetical protein